MNAAVLSIFGATFPIFVIASALSVRTCGDKSMPYMAAALASMAPSAVGTPLRTASSSRER